MVWSRIVGTVWRGGCSCSGQCPGSQGRGQECCCVNPCLPSARLALNGAGLMGLVRGLQLISVVHAAPRGAACQDYQGVCRWQSRHVCALMERGEWSDVVVPGGFVLRASLTALRSLVEFTPGIKQFGFTFSFNTSSSSRVVCYTFNCSSFEFSSPRLVPLQHQYLVILLLLLIANTCPLSSAANSGAGLGEGRVCSEDLRAWGNLRKMNPPLLPNSSSRFQNPALRRRLLCPPCCARQGCSGEGGGFFCSCRCLAVPAGHKQIRCI